MNILVMAQGRIQENFRGGALQYCKSEHYIFSIIRLQCVTALLESINPVSVFY